jgi:uncharacterized membrane protein
MGRTEPEHIPPPGGSSTASETSREKTVTAVVYGLHLLSFVFGISFIAAIIVNYVKRDDVRNTWLESHSRWQIRTFWFSVFWIVLGVVTSVILIGNLILAACWIWILYRAIKGLLRLHDGRPMYV